MFPKSETLKSLYMIRGVVPVRYERGNVIESYKLTIRRVTAIDWVHDTQEVSFGLKSQVLQLLYVLHE